MRALVLRLAAHPSRNCASAMQASRSSSSSTSVDRFRSLRLMGSLPPFVGQYVARTVSGAFPPRKFPSPRRCQSHRRRNDVSLLAYDGKRAALFTAMKLFSCLCDQLLFFESVSCIRCGRRLAYLPDRGMVAPIRPALGTDELVTAEADTAPAAPYR